MSGAEETIEEVEKKEEWRRVLSMVLGGPAPEETQQEVVDETPPTPPHIELESIPTPTVAKVGDYEVVIVEVKRYDFPWGKEYRVTCRLKDGDWVSPRFPLFVRDSKELAEKVKEEAKRYSALKTAGLHGVVFA